MRRRSPATHPAVFFLSPVPSRAEPQCGEAVFTLWLTLNE
jgi:hypothetical protein